MENSKPKITQLYGIFAMPGDDPAKMCENLKVGDVIFYFEIMPNLSDPDVSTTVTLIVADVVE